MGVYIKGATIESLLNLSMELEGLYVNGRMIEVAEPHGRLIEAPDVSEYILEDSDTGTREITVLGLMECYQRVNNAPTVIESEGE